MYKVLTCLGFEHDWKLVVLAGTVCFLASAVALSLFQRARVSHGRARFGWTALQAAVSGCGIWATHFIAMLAYDPGIGAGYSIFVTVLSIPLLGERVGPRRWSAVGVGFLGVLRWLVVWAPWGARRRRTAYQREVPPDEEVVTRRRYPADRSYEDDYLR